MRIVEHVRIINKGNYCATQMFRDVIEELEDSISGIVWPSGNNQFAINPSAHGNGVVPIKAQFAQAVRSRNWLLEHAFPRVPQLYMGEPISVPGGYDAHKDLSTFSDPSGKPVKPFIVEWETGNISSSHRSINKIALSLKEGYVSGAIVIVPSNGMYPYLTDRIGNIKELRPYLRLYEDMKTEFGYFGFIVVEHDIIDTAAPLMPKGSDGNARKTRTTII